MVVSKIKRKFRLPGCEFLRKGFNKKGSKKWSLLFCISLHYFLPPLTLAIIKMINAIKPTTNKMPHTMPALKIPSTTEQLPRQRTKKQARKEINNLIPFFSIFYQNAYLFLFKLNLKRYEENYYDNGERLLQITR
jgi:hypothetical protein